MRRVSYDIKGQSKQSGASRGLTFGDQKSLIYQPPPQSKYLRQFVLKNNIDNRVILRKQIRDYAEIRLDMKNFNCSMFMTEDQNAGFLTYIKRYKQDNLREIKQYNDGKNATKPSKIPQIEGSYNYCQYCKESFNNYFSHIVSQDHIITKRARFNKDQLDAVLLFNQPRVRYQQPDPPIINLKSKQQIQQYDKAQQQILNEFRISIHSFKTIERMVNTLKSRL